MAQWSQHRHRTSALLAAMVLSGCGIDCPPNYTEDIRTILVPLRQHLDRFFVDHRRYPDRTERDALLERSGCTITNPQKRTCTFRDLTFAYETAIGIRYPDPSPHTTQTRHTPQPHEVTPQEPTLPQGEEVYTFFIEKAKSHCQVEITHEGNVSDIECTQSSCITIDP